MEAADCRDFTCYAQLLNGLLQYYSRISLPVFFAMLLAIQNFSYNLIVIYLDLDKHYIFLNKAAPPR
jgi:hypothetical protein